MSEKIYLDNNATTPLDPDVLDVMIEELAGAPHNPSSIHTFGQEGKKRLSAARKTVADFLGVRHTEIVFTSGGTEGLNLLVRGANPAGHIIASDIDHPALYRTIQDLKREVTYLPVDSFGAPKPSDLEKAIRPNTTLIALSAANSETGVMLDIHAFANIAKKYQIPLIIDGVALLGKEPVTIPDGVSGIAFSAHKFHGPQGVGFIYIHPSFKPAPLFAGGGQEKGLRPGTENLPGILGMAHALTLLKTEPPYSELAHFRETFEATIIKALPDTEINGDGPRLSNTSNLYFPGVDGESLLIALDMGGIAASHATACASGALEPSRTLLNMGYTKERAASSLRFSFSRMNTLTEITQAATTLIALVKKQRTLTSV